MTSEPSEPTADRTPMGATVYRLDYRPGLRMFGLRFIAAAVLVVVAWFLAAAFENGAGRIIALGVGTLAVVLIGISVIRLIRPPMVARLDADGYRLGRIPGGGRRRAAWQDVTGAGTTDTAQGYALVLRTDGQNSTIPLLLVAGRAGELQQEVNQRLNTAYGYRRLS